MRDLPHESTDNYQEKEVLSPTCLKAHLENNLLLNAGSILYRMFFYDFNCLKCYKMTSFCPIFTIRSEIIPEVMWLQNNLILSKVCGSFHLHVAKSKMGVIRHFSIFGHFCYHMPSHFASL